VTKCVDFWPEKGENGTCQRMDDYYCSTCPDRKAVFNTLREASVARRVEWTKGETVSLSFRGNELAGETGEACNVIKKLERERMGFVGSRDTVQHLAEELADVVICADLVAQEVGIDLDQAVADKFNATSEKYGLSVRYVRNK
jgi:NTP pyrophosphatase (non-canonical NTP hydrolase)